MSLHRSTSRCPFWVLFRHLVASSRKSAISEPVEGSSQIEGTGGHSREACRADFRCLPQSQTEAGNRQTRCKALGTALPLPRFENASVEKQYYPDWSRARLGHFRQESSQPENDTCPRRSSRAPVQSRLGQNQPGTSQPGRRRLDGAQQTGPSMLRLSQQPQARGRDRRATRGPRARGSRYRTRTFL